MSDCGGQWKGQRYLHFFFCNREWNHVEPRLPSGADGMTPGHSGDSCSISQHARSKPVNTGLRARLWVEGPQRCPACGVPFICTVTGNSTCAPACLLKHMRGLRFLNGQWCCARATGYAPAWLSLSHSLGDLEQVPLTAPIVEH